MATDKYKAEDTVITVDGERVTGLAGGTFVEIEYNTELYSNEPDAYGENTVRTKMQDDTGQMSITLKQNSPSLQRLRTLSRNGDLVPARVVDTSKAEAERDGKRLVDCSIERPSFSRGDEVEEIEVVAKAAQVKDINVNGE